MGQEEDDLAKAPKPDTGEVIAEMPKPGNQPVILEIVEYVKYFLAQGRSKAEIKQLLHKVWTYQEVENAIAFYEKFLRK